MAEIPTEALEAAARAIKVNRDGECADWPDDLCQPCRPCIDAYVRAAAPHLIAEGRRQASDAILAHADRHAPQDGNEAQRRLRRHLDIAARVALPDLTDSDRAEIVAELVAALPATEVTTCGVCGGPFDPADPPPTWTLDKSGRPVLSKPIRVDPETGAVCWCRQPELWRCPRCGSPRWVAASLTGPVSHGGRAIRQCVPCGHYSDTPVPEEAS